MNQEENILEQIDLYLSGKMRPEESAEFSLRINADKELAELTERQKIGNDIVVGNRLNSLKAMMDHDFDSGIVRRTRWNLKWWLAGLGIITGTVFLGITYFAAEENSIVKESRDEKQSMVSSKSTSSVSEIHQSKDILQTVKTRKAKKSPLLGPDVVPLSDKPIIMVPQTETAKDVSPQKNELIYPEQNKNPAGPGTISKLTEVPVKKTSEEHKESILLNEPPVKKIDSHSFKPEFGEVFQIPVEPGQEAEFKILNRAGLLVFSQKVYGEQINHWDGHTIQGGISPPGLYIYTLDYLNGQKESGQIIVY